MMNYARFWPEADTQWLEELRKPHRLRVNHERAVG